MAAQICPSDLKLALRLAEKFSITAPVKLTPPIFLATIVDQLGAFYSPQ